MLLLVYDKTAPAAVRLRASHLVLIHAQRGIEIEDLDLRVAALEQTAKAPEGTP
jgi:hypothetical protein